MKILQISFDFSTLQNALKRHIECVWEGRGLRVRCKNVKLLWWPSHKNKNPKAEQECVHKVLAKKPVGQCIIMYNLSMEDENQL